MNCEWEAHEDGVKCSKCNKITKRAIKRNCPSTISKEPQIPNMIQRAKNFGKAVVGHVATGMKHCADEQRQERLDICSKNECGLFQNGVCSHRSCGCFIRNNGRFMDKLSWANSECPVGLWGKAEPESPENPENGV